MEKIKNKEDLIQKLLEKKTFEERYDFLIEDCKFTQLEISKLNMKEVNLTPIPILENLVRISQMDLDARKSERIEKMVDSYTNNKQKNSLLDNDQIYPNMNNEYDYLKEEANESDYDIDFILSHSLDDAKDELSEFLSDPDGNGMGIYGYDKRIHTIYENHMEKFLEKAKEITAPKKDNITHLEEDSIITIFNKKDNGLEKIATINLDETDNMIVNIKDVKMKNKIMDYVEEIQENKIVKVNISKGVNNEFDDFHQRVKKLYSQQNEKETNNNLSL